MTREPIKIAKSKWTRLRPISDEEAEAVLIDPIRCQTILRREWPRYSVQQCSRMIHAFLRSPYCFQHREK